MMRIFLMGIFIGWSLFSVAQDNAKAREILDEVSQKTRSYPSVSASFSFSMDNEEMDIHERNEGTIYLKGQKYVVELPEVGMKVYSDGETLWNYMEDGNQVTISSVEDNTNELMDPSSVFTIYEKGFDAAFIGEAQKDGQILYQVELYPDTDAYAVSKIVLYIRKSNSMIHSASLHGTDRNVYSIEVEEMNTGTELADSFFVFDTSSYGDLEVIDFR